MSKATLPPTEQLDVLSTLAYDYELPPSLIATKPTQVPSQARMMMVSPSGPLEHASFERLPEFLNDNDLLVFNDTKVLPVRVYARKETGGRVELFVLRVGDPEAGEANAQDWLDTTQPGLVSLWAMTRTSKKLRPGQTLIPDADPTLTLHVRQVQPGRALVEVQWPRSPEALMEHLGLLPLPPYIVRQRKERGEEAIGEQDARDYQSIFAQHAGAVAAPTASLHFDEDLMTRLHERGVRHTFVTLHVGAGTFKPVDADRLLDHPMHSEQYILSQQACDALEQTKKAGGRVIAVGTTCARVLEAQARTAQGFKPTQASTDIFLHPHNPLQYCDGLITNFHLPRSTLLALVAAATGYERMREVYAEAIKQAYRFYSYGDGMFISPIIRHQEDSP